ncbi:MAG: molybdopterin-containing oxidoreductase family protein [Burkholderiales bacterium]
MATAASANVREDGMHRVVHVVCPHDCPDTCSMLVTVDKATGKAIKCEGDPSHPVTQGYLCNKVNHYLDLVYNNNRVLYPHKRVGPKGANAKFQRIGWDEALKTIAERFHGIIKEHGAEAVQPFSYSGTLGMLGYWGMSERLWNKMGAARLGRTICIEPATTAGVAMLGWTGGADIEEIPNMDLVVLWGTNIVSTGVHIMPFVNQARENGAKVIAIDPRVTRTTAYADWHIQPRPGTDAAFVLGVMKILVDNNMHDEQFLLEQTKGWPELKATLKDYPLDKVAEITGLLAADIEKFAKEFGSTKKSFIRLNYGLQRHDNGANMIRCAKLLPFVTGAPKTGGGCCMGTLEETWAVDLNKLQRPDLLEGKTPRSLNMISMADFLNDPNLKPPVKAIYCWNADMANCVPNTIKMRKGLMRDDLFVVVHDTFFTDTTDYADIILPADTCFEHEDLHAAYGYYYFGLSNPVIPKQGESLDNQETFRRLAKAMGYTDECFNESDESMIRVMIDPAVNPLFEGITYESLKKNGWAKGAVKSPRRDFLKNGWPTASKKVEIISETLRDLDEGLLPMYKPEKEGHTNLEARKKYPVQVLSPATHYFIGDSFQHVPRLQDMMSRPTFEISAADAAQRGIQDGDLVRAWNDRGETYAYALIVQGLREGVMGAQKQFMGSRTPGGTNMNSLNTSEETKCGGGPRFYSVLCQIEKVADPSKVKINQEVHSRKAKLSLAG